jgi:N-methylhydantoinase A
MRAAFDIGGTFTDVLILDDDGTVSSCKMLSLLDDIGHDIGARIDLVAPAARVEHFVHATTICSNALIERTYARTALVTTRGFRDTLEMRSQKGPGQFSVTWRPPLALVPRQLCLEVDGRIRADGTIFVELDEEGVLAAADRLHALGVEAVAVCLVNSYLNPVHERRVRELLEPRLPDVDISLSSDVHPEIREYERTSTTTVNACLVPVVGGYLDRLEAQLERFGGDVHIMQSNGGIMASAAARRRPIAMIESGPVAGALAAAKLARELGLDQVVSFDMGGTTAKACLIRGGIPLERAGLEVSGAATAGTNENAGGYAVTVPTVDLVEVGAGGGSIAWVAGGSLRVGPASAGADPGPVCYGRGGTQPTVTDANVVLGYLGSDAIAGSTIPIDHDAAFAALRVLGSELDLDVMRAAYGIVQVANAVMMRALRAVSIERGYDPRAFSLVAFGGAGPVHAAALAATIGIETVIVPPFPGVFSALGLMLADYRLDLVRSVAAPLDDVDASDLLAEFAALEARATADMTGFGMASGEIGFTRQIDMKYAHQVEDLTIDFPTGTPAAGVRDALSARFTDAHRRSFGHEGRGTISVVNLRLQAITRATELRLSDIAARALHDEAAAPATPRSSSPVSSRPVSSRPVSSSPVSSRPVYFGPEDGFLDTPVLRRTTVGLGADGPLIVEEPDTTVVVPPKWHASLDDQGNLVVSRH